MTFSAVPQASSSLTGIPESPLAISSTTSLTAIAPANLIDPLQVSSLTSSSSAIADAQNSLRPFTPALLDTAGNTLLTAQNLGVFSGSNVINEFVGFNDPVDFYRFSLTNSSSLSLSLGGLGNDADLYLIRDFNQNGLVDDGDILQQSINAGTTPEFVFTQNLAAGSYFIGVAQYSGDTNYSLAYAVAPGDAGDTLATASDLGLLTGQQTISGDVGFPQMVNTGMMTVDLSDIYRFRLDATSNLQVNLTGLTGDADLYVIRDLNNNGRWDVGEDIGRSSLDGLVNETISLTGLAAGTYFVEVAQFTGATNYNLTLTADSAGSTFTTARNIGTLTGDRSFNDFVGTSDAIDYYRFNVTTAGTLSLRLDGMTADADLYLIRDINNNGMMEPNEIIAASTLSGNSPDSVNFVDLAAGTYYVQVDQYSGNTNYKLNFSFAATRPDPGNLLTTATNLGTLSGQRTVIDNLSALDQEDFYRFSLTTTSDLQVALTGLTRNADLFLIRDANNNGIVDSTDVIEYAMSPRALTESLSVTGLAAGTYFVGVRGYGNTTGYTLSLTSDAAGSTLATARNIGTLSGFGSRFTDYLSSQDGIDTYRFTLNSLSNVNINLPANSADFDLYLIQDINGNGLIDMGERMRISETDGSFRPEAIAMNLAAGIYYVQVMQYSGAANYTLNLNSTPLTLLF